MHADLAQQVRNNPRFQELVQRRTRFAWLMTAIVMAIYYGFILVVAFSPETLATPISDTSVISIGIPVGAGILVTCFIFTGIYVRRANLDYDQLTNQIKEELK